MKLLSDIPDSVTQRQGVKCRVVREGDECITLNRYTGEVLDSVKVQVPKKGHTHNKISINYDYIAYAMRDKLIAPSHMDMLLEVCDTIGKANTIEYSPFTTLTSQGWDSSKVKTMLKRLREGRILLKEGDNWKVNPFLAFKGTPTEASTYKMEWLVKEEENSLCSESVIQEGNRNAKAFPITHPCNSHVFYYYQHQYKTLPSSVVALEDVVSKKD